MSKYGFGAGYGSNQQKPAGFAGAPAVNKPGGFMGGYNQQQPNYQQGYGQQQPPPQQQAPQAGEPNFTYTDTVIYTTLYAGAILTVHMRGTVTVQPPSGAPIVNQVSGVIVLSADVFGDELAMATSQGICLMNLKSFQTQQCTPYNKPVGKVRYLSKDYLAASFLDMDMNTQQVNTVLPRQSGASRWSQPAESAQPAILYSVVVVGLDLQQVLADAPGLPCNGQFDVDQTTSSSGYSTYSQTDLGRIHVPCLTQYIDDDNIVRSYSVKISSGTVKIVEDSKTTKSSFGIEQTNAAFALYQYIKSKSTHVFALEDGQVFAGSKSSSTYRSGNSYGSGGYGSGYSKYGSNTNTNTTTTGGNSFNFQQRVNCMFFVEKENLLLIGTQDGKLGAMVIGKEPQVLGEFPMEITSIYTIGLRQDIMICVGSIQDGNAQQAGMYIAQLASDNKGGYALM